MTVLQTKIAVKSQKCSMSAERKSAGRTTPICSEEQPGVFGMSKKTIGGGQLICGSPQAANLRTGSRPVPGRGRASRPIFCRLNARDLFELHAVNPARFITTLKRPATTPSARTLAVQIKTSQPTLRSHVGATADGCAFISDTPRRLSPFRGIRNRTLRCRRG